MTNETIAEAAEKYAQGKSSSSVFTEAHINDFIAGAEWQAERLDSLWDKYRNETNNEDAWMFKQWLRIQFQNTK